MSLALLFHYLMFNMFRMLVHLFSGACDLFVELFHVLYCSGSMCVGVTVWFGWVVWYPYAGWSPKYIKKIVLYMYLSNLVFKWRHGRVNNSTHNKNAIHFQKCEYREKTNKMQQSEVYYQLLSQHVSGIIMPIFRRSKAVLLRMVYCSGSAGCGW